MSISTEQRFLDDHGRVMQWPSKQADKLLVLAYLASKFEYGQIYTESEVNGLLKSWHTFSDWPLLRRELFERDFLDRNFDGSDYHLKEIPTGLAGLTLVKPVVERDAHTGVKWLAGDDGHESLRLMGVTEANNSPSTLDEERKRVRSFITSTSQLTWMLRYQNQIVGAIWVDLQSTPYLPAPSVHIMIGNSAVRGKGIGENAMHAVIHLLKGIGEHDQLYSRHLLDNHGSARLLAKLGFADLSDLYKDKDGLEWQNVILSLS